MRPLRWWEATMVIGAIGLGSWAAFPLEWWRFFVVVASLNAIRIFGRGS